MLDTTIARPRAARAETENLKPVFVWLWLPYAVLALTVAAFYWNLPAKVAARMLKNQPAPRAELSRDLMPSSVNYPLPARSPWFTNPDGALLAHR